MTRRVPAGITVMVMVWTVALAGMAVTAAAGEHGGKEHGGTTTSTPAPKTTTPTSTKPPTARPKSTAPSASQIHSAVTSYVKGRERSGQGFTIHDPVIGTERTLKFVRVHDRVGKTGGRYYSCTDMKDAASGELLDLDFDVQSDGGKLSVVDVRIHKVSGKPRYTYDAKDRRVPVK